MTSNISFHKFLKENIRQRGWLAALSFILLFLSGTVYTIISIDSRMQAVSDAASRADLLTQSFPAYFNGCNRTFLPVAILLLAIMCAATGFSYLHSSERTDFFHGLPLTRKQWFLISYTGGLLIFLVPYLLNGLCTFLAGAAHGIMDAGLFAACCSSILGGILGFLVFYHTAILAMMLTGKLITGVLASLVLMVYPWMLSTLGSSLMGYFFHTYSGSDQSFAEKLAAYISPASLFIRLQTVTGHQVASDSAGSLPLFLCTFILLAVLALSAWELYRIRPSEAAGYALAFSGSASAVKILIAVPSALYAGVFVRSLFGTDDAKWCFIISILAVFLLCGVIEFIYQQDLRQLLNRKWSSLASVAGVIGLLCLLQFDLLGYDTRIPEKDRVESMSFSSQELYNYFTYPVTSDGVMPDFLNTDALNTTDIDAVYELAQSGVSNVKSGIVPDYSTGQQYKQGYIPVTVVYNLKNGRHLSRRYSVKREYALDALNAACENDNYRQALFPIFHLNETDIISISMSDIYCQPVSLKLSPDEQTALLDAYKKDVLSAEIDTLQNDIPLGEFIINYRDDFYNGDLSSYASMPMLYVYDSYKHTLSLLRKYGYTFREKIAPEDVIYMNRITSVEAETVNASGDMFLADAKSDEVKPVSSPEERAEILSQIHLSCSGILGGQNETARSVEIMLKGNSSSVYFPL